MDGNGCAAAHGARSIRTEKRLHTVPCRNYAQARSVLPLYAGCGTIISGHRGGMAPGYPENCIETFENTLSHMPSFFEIDPQMTRDSVIVLMHDPTIDRTTTGKGKVSDYTYEELQRFNLVDRQGTVTPYKIPRVSDVIRWSRGKTILNFDKKEVPRDVLIRLVNELKAKNVIYTVHSADDARTCYGLDPDAHFSAWIGRHAAIPRIRSHRDSLVAVHRLRGQRYDETRTAGTVRRAARKGRPVHDLGSPDGRPAAGSGKTERGIPDGDRQKSGYHRNRLSARTDRTVLIRRRLGQTSSRYRK